MQNLTFLRLRQGIFGGIYSRRYNLYPEGIYPHVLRKSWQMFVGVSLTCPRGKGIYAPSGITCHSASVSMPREAIYTAPLGNLILNKVGKH